jgi:hypothetical protein
MLTEVVYVVFRVGEHDRQHELSLWGVLKCIGRELEIFDAASIEHVDKLPAINGVSSKSIGMPRDDSLCLSLLNSPYHLIEDGAAWIPCSPGFFKGGYNLSVLVTFVRAV